MKHTTLFPSRFLIPLLTLLPLLSHAFVVNTGSDGSDGALVVTEDTLLALPDDGIFNFTTVTINSGATLRFIKNAANTPVYMLAIDDIEIAGEIDISGADGTLSSGGMGGPGGWDGGNRVDGSHPGGAGKGPGGGNYNYTTGATGGGIGGSYATQTSASGATNARYGSPLLIPLLGGSGGSGSKTSRYFATTFGAGGGGGGAILVASETQITLTGSIISNGGKGGDLDDRSANNGGSGGGVRLLAPVIEGTGSVSASGLTHGGRGYIRIDAGASTLSTLSGVVTYGRNAIIFPEAAPELRITNVAGSSIPLNNNNQAYVNLPPTGQPDQPVTVRASGFGSVVNIQIVLVPTSGDRIISEHTIDNRFDAVTEQTFTVTFPLDQLVDVYVFTSQTLR